MSDDLRACPFCAEAIRVEAIKCKFCSSWLDGHGAGEGDAEAGISWDGATLVVQRGASMPTDRCVRCGRPADGRPIRRKLQWHHPAIYLALLVNVLVYLVIALVLTKRMTLEFGICAEDRSKRFQAMTILSLMALAGPLISVALCVGLGTEEVAGVSALVGGGILLAALVGLVLCQGSINLVRPTRIDDREARLTGVHRSVC